MGLIKNFIKKRIDKFGYVVTLKDQSKLSKSGMEDGLLRMKKLGIYPEIVIDIGAAQGNWTTTTLSFWPNAGYVLIEPLVENKARLDKLHKKNPNIRFHLAVAGEFSGEAWLEVSPDLDGSGIYGGQSSNSRPVPIICVDEAVGGSVGPFILKLDTHGYEVPIIKGATETLKNTQLLVLEVYGFKISPTCLLFHEISQYLDNLGFRLIDIVDIMRRPGDNAFWQADAFFIKKNHPVFDNNTYA